MLTPQCKLTGVEERVCLWDKSGGATRDTCTISKSPIKAPPGFRDLPNEGNPDKDDPFLCERYAACVHTCSVE